VRVLLLSDTHGALGAGVLEQARASDLVVHAGDVGGAQVLEALAAAAPRVVAVRGNNDTPAKWPRAERAALAALPACTHLELPGGVLVAVHGDGLPAATRHARLRERFAGARAIVYGHSHRGVVDLAQRPWVLNPGAAGRVRTFGGPSALWLEARRGRWRVTPWRAEAAGGGRPGSTSASRA
jgi:putative phosphoesterase